MRRGPPDPQPGPPARRSRRYRHEPAARPSSATSTCRRSARWSTGIAADPSVMVPAREPRHRASPLRAAVAGRPPRRLGDLLDERPRHRLPRPRPLEWRGGGRGGRARGGAARRSAARRGGAPTVPGRRSSSTRRTSTGCTRRAAARRSRSTPTRRRCGGWAHTPSRPTALCGAPRSRTPRSCGPRTATPRSALAGVLERGCARALVPDRRRRHPRGARPRPAPAARAPAGGASRCRGCRRSDGWLVTRRDLALQVDARRRDVHGRRPALLDRAGRRAEHAHARRRRARAPPRPVRAAVPARRGARALHGASCEDETDAADRRARAGRARRSCGAGSPGRSPRAIVTLRARAARTRTPAPCSAGTTRSSRRSTEVTAGEPVTAAGPRGVRRAARRDRAGARARRRVVAAGGRGRRRGRPRARRGGLERRRAAVRRHRDDRGHDRQRARCTCSPHPDAARARSRPSRALLPNAIEESLRLEPAAAVIDRYATRDVELGGAPIRRGELVTRLDRRRRTATRPSSPTPTASTCGARTRASTSRSRTARTSASGCTSRGSRRTRRSAGVLDRLPGLRLDPGAAGRAARARVPQAARAARRVGLRLPSVILDGRGLTPGAVEAVARGGAEVELAGAARERNAAAARALDELLERGEPVYGVTTGVGPFRTRPVPPEQRGDQQLRLLRSHACGGGRAARRGAASARRWWCARTSSERAARACRRRCSTRSWTR